MKNATVVAIMMMAATMYGQENNVARGCFAEFEHYQHVNIAVVEKNYLECLQSSNEGVTESALAQVAMLKLANPDARYKPLRTKVAELAFGASTPELRYKAYLVTTVLDQPEIFKALAKESYGSPDGLFSAVASRLCLYSMK